MALEEELGVLIDRVMVHPTAAMAARLVPQIQLVVLGYEAKAQNPGLKAAVRSEGTPLASIRGEVRDGNP